MEVVVRNNNNNKEEMTDREIKVDPKLSKRLMYLGFEEKNLNIEGVPDWKLNRYFVHPSGIQVRVNREQKTLTILNAQGYSIKTEGTFLNSHLKELIGGSNYVKGKTYKSSEFTPRRN